MKQIYAVLAAVLFSAAAHAQWDTLNTQCNTSFNGIAFLNPDTGFAAGFDPVTGNGDVRRTYDGGQTWQSCTVSLPATTHINTVIAPFSTSLWCAGNNGYLLHSSNAGQTWDSISRFTTKNIYCLSFPTDTNGYAAGENGILYRTNDWGNTWTAIISPTALAIRDMYFKDAANGWVVGDGGVLAATADSGRTWQQVTQPYFGFFHCNSFAYAGSSLNAFAVGNYGDMITSANAGLTWDSVSTGTFVNLNAVRFMNDLAGIVVGDYGYIRRTNNGGMTWVDVSLPYVNEDLNGICFAGDTTAFICGDSGTVLKTYMDISSVHNLAPSLSLAAFPNPFSNELHLAMNLEAATSVRISICDVSGRTVVLQDKGELPEGKQLISITDLDALAPGMYLLRVETAEGATTLQLIKN